METSTAQKDNSKNVKDVTTPEEWITETGYNNDRNKGLLNNRINVKVMFTQSEVILKEQAIVFKMNEYGHTVGIPYSNPLLYTSVYRVCFDDGHVQEYRANIIV